MFRLTRAPVVAAQPRYNIAPTQSVPVIREQSAGRKVSVSAGGGAGSQRRERTLDYLRWGFVPHWADDPSIGSRMINARAETAAEKPAFRKAFLKRRCLIPADAFYEWKKSAELETDTSTAQTGKSARAPKQPYAIRMRDGQPFALAGLWERWNRSESGSGEDQVLETFTILTTEPNELVRTMHNRMPAIINPAEFDRWLDPNFDDAAALQAMLRPVPASQMVAYPVTTRINRADYEGPECLQPLSPSDARQTTPPDSAVRSHSRTGARRKSGSAPQDEQQSLFDV